MPTTRSIGDGIRTTGVRTYRTEDGKSKLVVWTDKLCVICNCFLTKEQHKFCAKHGVGSKEYTAYNKERYHAYNEKYRGTHHSQEIKRHAENYRKTVENNCLAAFSLLLSKARNSGVLRDVS